MKSTYWKEREKEEKRTLHGKPWRRTREEKLKVLRMWRLWRKEGYEVRMLEKRLQVAKRTVRLWAEELGFDLEGGRTGVSALPSMEGQRDAGATGEGAAAPSHEAVLRGTRAWLGEE